MSRNVAWMMVASLGLLLPGGCEQESQPGAKSESAQVGKTSSPSSSQSNPSQDAPPEDDSSSSLAGCAKAGRGDDPAMALVLELDDEGIPRALLCNRSSRRRMVAVDRDVQPLRVGLRTSPKGRIIERAPVPGLKQGKAPPTKAFKALEPGGGYRFEGPLFRERSDGYELRWHRAVFQELDRGTYDIRVKFHSRYSRAAEGTRIPSVWTGKLKSDTVHFSVPPEPAAPEFTGWTEQHTALTEQLSNPALGDKLKNACDEAKGHALRCADREQVDACVREVLQACR
jgi:hypothetical protein